MSANARDVIIPIIECRTDAITLGIYIAFAVVVAIFPFSFITCTQLVIKALGTTRVSTAIWTAYAGRWTIYTQLRADIARVIAAVTAWQCISLVSY